MPDQNTPPAPPADGTGPAGGSVSLGDDNRPSKVQTGSVSGAIIKEQEPNSPVGGEEEILSEIVSASEAADEQAEKELQSAISEARLSKPEPEIAPEVAEGGVVVPQREANEVVVRGTTIELPISESLYQRGLHQKVVGKVVDKVVVGTSSLFMLAKWAERIIKMIHHHTVKRVTNVIFRKPSFAKAPEGKEENKDAN